MKIVAEAELLAEAGVREITLIGQNVNAYHGQGPDGAPWTLGRLLERLADLPGIARLRYTTSHPCDMDASLIAAHRDLPSLMPSLHLPVQSGSDRVLKRMNRRHTRAGLCQNRCAHARRPAKNGVLVRLHRWLPWRERERFRATLSLVEEVGYANAFSFKYSPRPGTPAADLRGQVPDAVKSERLYRLQAAIERQQAAFNEQCLGRTFDVLFEKAGRYPGQIVGRSPYLQPVHVMAPRTMIAELGR